MVRTRDFLYDSWLELVTFLYDSWLELVTFLYDSWLELVQSQLGTTCEETKNTLYSLHGSNNPCKLVIAY
jgi:hypothetical protein